MAPKTPSSAKRTLAAAAAAAATTKPAPSAQTQSSSTSSPATASSASTVALRTLWATYLDATPSRLKLIDAFLVFLILTGVVQFVYCVLVTSFPFNAFLAGYVRRGRLTFRPPPPPSL